MEKMISQLILEMDDIPPNKRVIVLAATNTPEVIDPSFLRSGTFFPLFIINYYIIIILSSYF